MEQEIAQLQETNNTLKSQLTDLSDEKTVIQDNLGSVIAENSSLQKKIDDLNLAVEKLQDAELQIQALVTDLTTKIDNSAANDELKNQLGKLENLQDETRKEINSIAKRLSSLENQSSEKESQTTTTTTKKPEETTEPELPGIFGYFENDSDGALFAKKVSEAVSKGMTYAQIDKHLKSSLSKKVYAVAKGHPTLTKTYIRSVREK